MAPFQGTQDTQASIHKGNEGTPTPVYTIGSEKGYNIVNQLQPGQSTNDLAQDYRPTDGSVWTKNQDGTIGVFHQGQQMIGNVTYKPQVQAQVQANRPALLDQSQQTVTDDPFYVAPTPSQSTSGSASPIVPVQSQLIRPSQSENRITAADIEAMYQQMQDAQNAKIDYTVQQAVDELTRAQEDAQKGFETQRNQVNIDEAQARDAQVLYAAARGDRGGITARQYDSISNTAANNRHAIAEAQQKLATDTARQIADLRAQGEFEKADALLQIAQQQLAQLWELQQYNDNLLLQEQQLAMQESTITGSYGGQLTLDAQLAQREWEQALKEWDYNTAQQEREWAYQIAMQSIQAGVTPTADILAAAGIDASTASQMASIYKAANTPKVSSTGSSTGTKTEETKPLSTKDVIYVNAKEMYENGVDDASIWNYLVAATGDEAKAQTYAGFLGLVLDNGGAPTPTEPTIKNAHGDDWVQVAGFSRLSWQELYRMVEAGQIIERYDEENNTVTYVRNRQGTN